MASRNHARVAIVTSRRLAPPVRPRLIAALLLSVLAGAAAARVPRVHPCRVREQVFLSPAGAPFRSGPDAPAPVAAWFSKADGDGDGRLTLAEWQADGARFFATVDGDGSGEIILDELARYERVVAPEISIYDDYAPSRSRRPPVYGSPIGGARYALTNVPNPIAAADLDMNRGTMRAELLAATARAFATIAKGRGALALADLPATPQAALLAACAARAAKANGGRR